MSNSIDLVIGSDAIKQVENLLSKLTLADAELIRISESARTASKGIASISTPSGLDASVSTTKALNAELEKQNKIITDLTKQISLLNEKRKPSVKLTMDERVQNQENNKVLKQESLERLGLVSVYTKLNKSRTDAKNTLRDLIASEKASTDEIKRAQREYDILDKKVKKADNAVGDFSKNVGNYKSAFSGLTNLLGAFGIVGGLGAIASVATEIFQTTKELQSLDLALKAVTETEENFSFQQSFLKDISQKYGVEIQNLTKLYTSFYVASKDKLAGKEIQDIFENIAKSGSTLGLSNETLQRSFTAVNQMLSKGTVASEELRGQLAEALPGAVQAMTKAVQVLHPELKNLTEKDLFAMIKAGKILASEVLPETARQLVLLTGADKAKGIETLNKSTARLSNTWTDFVRTLTEGDSKLSKLLSGSVNFLTIAATVITSLLKSSEQSRKEYTESLKDKGYSDVFKQIEGFSKEELELTKKNNSELIKENAKKVTAILEQNKKISLDNNLGVAQKSIMIGQNSRVIKQINNSSYTAIGANRGIDEKLNPKLTNESANNEASKAELKALEKSKEDRLKLIYDLSKAELELQILKKTELLKNDIATYDQQFKTLSEYSALKLMLINLTYQEEVRLAKGNKDKIRIAQIERESNQIKQTEDTNTRLKSIKDRQIKDKKDEEKNFVDGLKDTQNEIDDARKSAEEVEATYQKNSLNRIDEQIEKVKKAKEEIKSYLDSFAQEFASQAGFSETFSMLSGEIEGFGKDFKVTFNAIAETAQETFNFINQFSQAGFDQEKERLQAQYDIALGFAGNSTEAQQKLAEELETRKKEIANRENEQKKRQAIFNIAIDTAQAIAATIGKTGFFGIPLAFIVGALGLAQIALVQSQEVPQYAEGTDYHGGGLMIVNDGKGANFKEKIITPDGKVMIPDGRNVLMNAPKGTKVLTHEQQIQEMLNERGISMSNSINSSGMTADEMDNVLAKHFGKIQINNTTFDKNGIDSWFENNGSRTRRNENRVSRTGFKV